MDSNAVGGFRCVKSTRLTRSTPSAVRSYGNASGRIRSAVEVRDGLEAAAGSKVRVVVDKQHFVPAGVGGDRRQQSEQKRGEHLRLASRQFREV